MQMWIKVVASKSTAAGIFWVPVQRPADVDGKGKAQQKSFLGRQNGRIRTVDSLGDVIRGKLWLLAAMGGEGIVKFVQ